MAVSKDDIIRWGELLQLAGRLAVAAVAALESNEPIDFDAVKITVTPEKALEQARRSESGSSSSSAPQS